MTTPLSGTICLPKGWDLLWSTCTPNLKSLALAVPEISLGTKNLKWVTWRGHAHFRDILSSLGWHLLWSTHVLSLKYLRLPATKKWRATPNVNIFVLSHPLGDRGNVHGSSIWLVEKRVVDFLLVLIELFSPTLPVKALWAKIGRNCAVRKGGLSLWAQISGGRWVVHQRILASEN